MSFNTARIQRPYNGSKKTDVKLSLQRILENLPAGQEVTKIVPIYFRAKEADTLLGDTSKARNLLDWKPIYKFEDLVADTNLSEFTVSRLE